MGDVIRREVAQWRSREVVLIAESIERYRWWLDWRNYAVFIGCVAISAGFATVVLWVIRMMVFSLETGLLTRLELAAHIGALLLAVLCIWIYRAIEHAKKQSRHRPMVFHNTTINTPPDDFRPAA